MKIFRLEIIYNDMEYACTNEYPKKQLRVYYSKWMMQNKKKGEKYSLKCVVITTYTWNRSGEKMITSDNPFLKSYHEKMLNEKNGQTWYHINENNISKCWNNASFYYFRWATRHVSTILNNNTSLGQKKLMIITSHQIYY